MDRGGATGNRPSMHTPTLSRQQGPNDEGRPVDVLHQDAVRRVKTRMRVGKSEHCDRRCATDVRFDGAAGRNKARGHRNWINSPDSLRQADGISAGQFAAP